MHCTCKTLGGTPCRTEQSPTKHSNRGTETLDRVGRTAQHYPEIQTQCRNRVAAISASRRDRVHLRGTMYSFLHCRTHTVQTQDRNCSCKHRKSGQYRGLHTENIQPYSFELKTHTIYVSLIRPYLSVNTRQHNIFLLKLLRTNFEALERARCQVYHMRVLPRYRLRS